MLVASADAALLAVKRKNVLVSDIRMPEMDGYELLQRIRALGEAKGRKLPAIALTAFARGGSNTRAAAARFIFQPVELSELIATIADIVPPYSQQD